jgi:hypothetical protein
MMRSLHALAILVAIYVTVLLVRTKGLIEVKFFGIDGSSFPKWGVWAVHTWAFLFFYGGSVFLIKGYSAGWMKSIEILGKETKVTDANRWIVLRGLWFTSVGLVGSLGAIMIPSRHFRVDHIEIGTAFIIGMLTSFLPAIWSLRKLREQAAASDGG